MKSLLSPSFSACVEEHSASAAVMEGGVTKTFQNLKATLSVLMDSTQRLQKIQDQHESLLVEINRALEICPECEEYVTELVSNAGCAELNFGCIKAIECLTDSLKAQTAALWKAQLQ
jgi:CRISPR/Cas system-associated protein Csm6